MSRSTFNILFYANKSKEKNGIVPIMGRVTINGTQSQFSSKKTIPLDMWDVKGNCAKGRSKEALQINRDLDNIKAQIIKHYQRLSDREGFVTAEMVRNAYQGLGSEYETLLGAFDKDIANLKRRVGKDRAEGTYKIQMRSRNYIADFLRTNYKRNDIAMQELTPDFIKEFSVYLSNDRGLAHSTIWLSCMQGVVGRAHDNGKIQRNVFAQFHISPKCKERTFLTEEELKTVMTHEFEDANLAFIRDLFVFMNVTALSFVDLKELTTDNIVEISGEKWIIGKRHKTDVPYQVKLLDVPLQIIKRYRTFPKENPKSVFGEVNYWSVCKKLKTVMKECGIEKSISAHCARHGFATMALTNGMPIESVSRVLGHTNIVTTQIYARITTKKLDNDLTMLCNKLNASFSNIKTA